jgi:rod shape determining protein RodA
MVVMAMIDYRFIARFYIPIYLLCLGLLVAVMIIGPDDITGTARWIPVSLPGGLNMSLQPSEFAKIFMIVFLAGFIHKRNINHPLWLPLYLVLAAIPVVMIERQPSLSASMVVLSIALFILFIGGLYFRTIIISLVLLLPLGIFFYFDLLRNQPLVVDSILSPAQLQRIDTFFNPVAGDAALQINRSIFAIGSGGMYGQGFHNNVTFVIHGHNDFVFAYCYNQVPAYSLQNRMQIR